MGKGKRFIIFSGFKYYAPPGWTAYIDESDTFKNAIYIAIEKSSYYNFDWWQVVDLKKRKIVAGEGSAQTGLYGEYPANPKGDKNENKKNS